MPQSAVECLESGEYMQMKNTIVILNQVVECFPLMQHNYSRIHQCATAISDKDPRDDVKVSSRGYLAKLAYLDRTRGWIREHKFHHVPGYQSPPPPEVRFRIFSSIFDSHVVL